MNLPPFVRGDVAKQQGGWERNWKLKMENWKLKINISLKINSLTWWIVVISFSFLFFGGGFVIYGLLRRLAPRNDEEWWVVVCGDLPPFVRGDVAQQQGVEKKLKIENGKLKINSLTW